MMEHKARELELRLHWKEVALFSPVVFLRFLTTTQLLLNAAVVVKVLATLSSSLDSRHGDDAGNSSVFSLIRMR